jgi:disulfide bond formation protein DsbB
LKSLALSSAAKPTQRYFLALLIVVVLFAQWMGMRHRIEHANWVNSQPPAGQIDARNGQDDFGEQTNGHKHSCTLFDGTALADTVAIIPLTLPPPTCPKVLALWLAFSSWDAPLTRFFFSRAPPA